MGVKYPLTEKLLARARQIRRKPADCLDDEMLVCALLDALDESNAKLERLRKRTRAKK